jgi:hypothetical protein
METMTKAVYALLGIILPLALLAADVVLWGAAVFPMIWLFLWIGFSLFIILPWTE